MWVYGDRSRQIRPREALRALTAVLREVQSLPAGPDRHDRLTAAFLQASALAQGLADAEFAAKGADDISPTQDAAMALLIALARKLAASAWSGFAMVGPPSSAELMGLALAELPEAVEVKTPEGYAFYAVYPEAYLKAAAERPWPSPPLAIGLRSIGTGLAALVAAVTRAETALTLRPTGHPFHREIRASAALRARLGAHDGPFAIVDEGPGMSGSSFASAAELLAELGVAPERIVFMPSHTGEPGPQATPEHRERWRSAPRRPATFEALIEDQPLAAWFEDLTGPVLQLEDLSGGAWAAGRPDAPPAHPTFERRKYRLTTAEGIWLARFAGLGVAGEAKLARARTLARAGVAPEPLGLRRGFLVERWVEGEPRLQAPREALVQRLGRYLGLRALAFPAAEADGAALEDLAVMARVNAAELLGEQAAASLPPPPAEDRRRPVHVDARLHAWEWLTTPEGRLVKCDAVDHSSGHDLVGCQDIAWDVAGARAEFALDERETDALCAEVAQVCEHPVDRELLAFYDAAYAAFQAGLWSLAGEERQVARYRSRLAAFT